MINPTSVSDLQYESNYFGIFNHKSTDYKSIAYMVWDCKSRTAMGASLWVTVFSEGFAPSDPERFRGTLSGRTLSGRFSLKQWRKNKAITGKQEKRAISTAGGEHRGWNISGKPAEINMQTTGKRLCYGQAFRNGKPALE